MLKSKNKKLKDLKKVYIEFNKMEENILRIVNSTNGSGYINEPTGYGAMIEKLKNNLDGIALAKIQEKRIKKINKLAEEILRIDEDMKEDLNSFVSEHYPEEFKKLD